MLRKARQLDPALSRKHTAKQSESEDSEDDEPSDTDSETKQLELETTQLPLLERSNRQIFSRQFLKEIVLISSLVMFGPFTTHQEKK